MNTTAFRGSGVFLQWGTSESTGAVVALVTAPQQEGTAQMNTTGAVYIYIYVCICISI